MRRFSVSGKLLFDHFGLHIHFESTNFASRSSCWMHFSPQFERDWRRFNPSNLPKYRATKTYLKSLTFCCFSKTCETRQPRWAFVPLRQQPQIATYASGQTLRPIYVLWSYPSVGSLRRRRRHGPKLGPCWCEWEHRPRILESIDLAARR